MNFPETTFLLTGCASGIGRHLSQALVERGAKVYMTDADEEPLECHVNALREKNPYIRAEMMDVRDPAHWKEVIDKAVSAWGKLDVVMNIAGVVDPGKIYEATPAQIDLHLDVNAKGTLYGTQAAAAQMVRQRHGHIINIASLGGLVPLSGMSLYTASKFAVRGFSLAIASELIEHGVFVTIVCPDAVATPMLAQEAKQIDAALSFAGGRILSVRDIERAIFQKVLPRKPVEVIVPFSMNFLTRLVTALPGLTPYLLPYFRNKGLKRQARYRDQAVHVEEAR